MGFIAFSFFFVMLSSAYIRYLCIYHGTIRTNVPVFYDLSFGLAVAMLVSCATILITVIATKYSAFFKLLEI